MTNFTTVIISGGKSSRMGTDKALLEIGGKTMIEQIVAQTAGLGGEQIVITNTRSVTLNLPMFLDVLPDRRIGRTLHCHPFSFATLYPRPRL